MSDAIYTIPDEYDPYSGFPLADNLDTDPAPQVVPQVVPQVTPQIAEPVSDASNDINWLDLARLQAGAADISPEQQEELQLGMDQLDALSAAAEPTVSQLPVATHDTQVSATEGFQLLQPPIVPSQPIVPTQPVVLQSASVPAPANAPVPTVAPTQPAGPSQPEPIASTSKSVKAPPPFISAIDVVECNVRYNPTYHTSGLRSWGALKPILEEEIAKEAQRMEGGAMPFVQIPWDEALRHLGKLQFRAYYNMQVERATANSKSPAFLVASRSFELMATLSEDFNLKPLPEWIMSYCWPQKTVPPSAAVTSHAVANKILNRGSKGKGKDKGKGKAKATRASHKTPYARQ